MQNVQQEILHKTLQEVAALYDQDESTANPCVICLDAVTEAAVAIPCKHANFDFLCLASWLQQRRVCPLCKSAVTAIKYDFQSSGGPKLYSLPHDSDDRAAVSNGVHHGPTATHRPRPRRRRRPFNRPPVPSPDDADHALSRRRHVYRNQLFSLRVGSNRLSQYRELTPQLFNHDENLVSRARKWIRRELQVFEFLNPDGVDDGDHEHHRARPGGQRLHSRRANNAEFLLEYIIAILRTVDLKDSAGQAEELLQEFVGRENARLFLHELDAWLRSPFNSLQDWDRNVQYRDTGVANSLPLSSSVSAESPRPRLGRVEKRHRGQQYRDRYRPADSAARARRVQQARQRYQPD